MKILYLLQDLPYPPTDGVRIKAFNLIKYMAQEHECHVLTFGGEDVHARAEEFRHEVPGVTILGLFRPRSELALQFARIKHLLCGDPPFLAKWASRGFAQAIEQSLESTDYDLVHLDALSMAPYLHLCQSKPTVLSTTDAVSLAERRAAVFKNPLERGYRNLSAWLTERLESRWLPQATKIHLVSEVDCQYLRARIPSIDADFINNAVPDELINYPLQSSKEEGRGARILFSGLLKAEGIARGLLSFMSSAYPVILAACPDVEMAVLGRSIPPRVRRQLERFPNTRTLEWVEDYYAEVAKADVVIFPDLSGTGIKNRVLYALGLARAIVATPVALEGIAALDGVHCLRCETPEEFAHAVLLLLKDEELRSKLGQAARAMVKHRYTMEIMGRRWLELYCEAIGLYAERRSI